MATLKDFVKQTENGQVDVDEDGAYPLVMDLLGLEQDQYGLEVAFQCIKMAVQEMYGSQDKVLVINMRHGPDKERWAQAGKPTGKGWAAATKGREARTHYDRIRSKIL